MPAIGPATMRRADVPTQPGPFVFLRVPRQLWQQVVEAAPPGVSATKEAIARLEASFAPPPPEPEPAPQTNGRKRTRAAD
jgi:hypothetical protein